MAETILDRMTKARLQLLVEAQGELVVASDRAGVGPLRDAVFDHPALLDGADVAIPSLGLATAYLLIHAKVGRVFTPLATNEARRALDDEGIENHPGRVAKRLDEKAEPSAGEAALDDRARAAVTPLAFVEDLRRQTV